MFFLTVSFITLELTEFDFGVFFSIPAYLHFTEIYSVELLPSDSQRGHLFNIYTLYNAEVGIYFKFNLYIMLKVIHINPYLDYFHTLEERRKNIFALLSLYSLLSTLYYFSQ